MKNIILNKKIILIILSLLLLLIVLSNYSKTTEVALITNIFSKEEANSSADKLFFAQKDLNKKEAEIKEKNTAPKTVPKKENKSEAAEIKTIVLIDEIKDPFKIKKNKSEANSNEERKEKINNTNNKNDLLKVDRVDEELNLDKNLIFLEKNIIAETLAPVSAASKVLAVNKDNQNFDKDLNANSKNKNLKNIKVPFKLLGIIKQQEKASALFLYQGQNILKREKDKIDLFKIEEIKNKEIILSYQGQKKRLKLWEVKKE